MHDPIERAIDCILAAFDRYYCVRGAQAIIVHTSAREELRSALRDFARTMREEPSPE